MGKWRFDFAAALAAGLIILFFGALLGQYVEVLWPDENLEYWLNRYQTALAGLVAVVGLVGVSGQIQATQRQTRAALEVAHKPELGAFVLSKDILARLIQHVDFTYNFAVAHHGAGAPPPPPVVSHDDVLHIRRTLSVAGTDPFGMIFIHDFWASSVRTYYSGHMVIDDLLVSANFVREHCNRRISQADDLVDKLHELIDASL